MARGDPCRDAALDKALQLLPLRKDAAEAGAVARLLCTWLQGSDDQLLTKLGVAPPNGDAGRLASTLSILAAACSSRVTLTDKCAQLDAVGGVERAALPSLRGVISSMLVALQRGLPPALLQATMQLLSEESRGTLLRVAANPEAGDEDGEEE